MSETQTIRTAELKRYSLELYDREQPQQCVWKVDSDDPFAPMAAGDRFQPMDAPGARQDLLYEILAIEHLVWTAGEKVRYITRIFTRPTTPFAG